MCIVVGQYVLTALLGVADKEVYHWDFAGIEDTHPYDTWLVQGVWHCSQCPLSY